jgi:hypothetical protein
LSEPVTKSPTAAPVSNRVDGSLRLTLLRRRCACRYVNCFRLFIDAFQSYRPLLSSILDEAPRPSCSNCTCRARAVHDPSCGRACWPLRADAPPASARRDRSGSADGSGRRFGLVRYRIRSAPRPAFGAHGAPTALALPQLGLRDAMRCDAMRCDAMPGGIPCRTGFWFQAGDPRATASQCTVGVTPSTCRPTVPIVAGTACAPCQ